MQTLLFFFFFFVTSYRAFLKRCFTNLVTCFPRSSGCHRHWPWPPSTEPPHTDTLKKMLGSCQEKMPRKRTCHPRHKSNHDKRLLNIPKTRMLYRLVISPLLIHSFLSSVYGGKKRVLFFFFFPYCFPTVLSVNISELKLCLFHTWAFDVGDYSLQFHGNTWLSKSLNHIQV